MTIIENVISQYEELFEKSKKAKNTNHTLANFFNNTSMARILDIYLDNKDIWISLSDLVRLGISRKSIENNIPLLMEKGILKEDFISPFKFYIWNNKNPQAKHLEKLRDIL